MTTRLTAHHNKKVALYARFSSDLQKDRSVEDQFAELERVATKLGLKTDKRHYYADRGVSATSLFDRPGLTRDLLSAAQRGEFEAVLVEATDRLSRDRADLFWLAKRFTYYNITLFTPMGEVSDMQLTFDGHSNEDFVRKLAVRVKRGHDSITREGKIAGSKCYGYDCVPNKPGERVINEEEAKVIRRIFSEYAGGSSPQRIVAGLRRDGIPSPSGKAVWNYQGILGSNAAATGAGLLHRELYRGKIIRNRTKSVKNPDTGRRVVRMADADDIITVDAPSLRIVSDELWDAAHAVREKRRHQMNPAGTVTRPVIGRKPHLLAGILKCATCNGAMTVTSSTRGGQIACSNARHRGTCDHVKMYHLPTITDEVIAKMDRELTDPEFLKVRVKARAEELAKAERDEGSERQAVQRQIDRLSVQISRLVDMVADGAVPVEEAKERLNAKDAERASLRERLRLLGSAGTVTTLQPTMLNAWTKSVDTLTNLLRRTPDDPACRMAFANVIDTVLVHPTPRKAPYELSMYARVSAVKSLNLFPEARSHEKIIKDEGVTNSFDNDKAVTSD